jgi:6-pyruvoyltetrahydropterin/6-carboxytetrahydropterin synthase
MKAITYLSNIFSTYICLARLISGHPAEGFTLGIRDSIMIAHAFEGEEFGPAQSLHGATYTVDVELSSHDLVERVNWVIDIGEFSTILSDVLGRYNFKNLNEIFPDENSTTEFMCRRIHGDLVSKLTSKCQKGGLSVKLHESHKAWASYSKEI